MMILRQNPETGYWTDSDHDGVTLRNVHSPTSCESRGCAVHNHPTNHRLKDAPMNWREDRGILERICEHGVGHPDIDSALYLDSIGAGYQNIHACHFEGPYSTKSCCGYEDWV